MNIRDRKGLKQAAASRLSEANYNPRLLMLIHTGVSMGITLLITLFNYVLQQQIGNTGGLGGIGLRTVLTTAQTVLQLAGMLLLPFWEIGIVYAAMGIARSQPAGPVSLTEGFRRFGPVLRLLVLRTAILLAAAFLCLNISSGIFLMTPLSDPLYDILLPLAEAASAENAANLMIDNATMAALADAMTPMLPIFLVLFVLLAAPLLYRLRLADYLILEEKKTGALHALLTSWRMMRGRAFSLFRLDLSFWWFYGLQGLAFLLSYGDSLLPAFGVSLPFSADVSYFLFFFVYLGIALALYWRFGSYLQTTYAVAYDTLRYQSAMPIPKPAPQKMPWDYETD